MDNDAGVFYALDGGVKRLDGPVFIKVRPSKLIELDEVDP
jgi:hypothetical protein